MAKKQKKRKAGISGAENVKPDLRETVFWLFKGFRAFPGSHTDWLAEGRIILGDEGHAAPGSHPEDSPFSPEHLVRRPKRIKNRHDMGGSARPDKVFVEVPKLRRVALKTKIKGRY